MKHRSEMFIGARIDPDADEGALPRIRAQHRFLCALRDDPKQERTPEREAHLEQDILVYEHILQSPHAGQLAEEYAEAMEKEREKRGYGVTKIDVAKKLGWFH